MNENHDFGHQLFIHKGHFVYKVSIPPKGRIKPSFTMYYHGLFLPKLYESSRFWWWLCIMIRYYITILHNKVKAFIK